MKQCELCGEKLKMFPHISKLAERHDNDAICVECRLCGHSHVYKQNRDTRPPRWVFLGKAM